MLSKVKKVFSNKSRKFSNSKSNENCKTSSVVSVTSSLPDFTREFSTLTEECGYVPTVLVNAAKIIEAHIEDKFLFQTQGSVGKVDYLIQILGRDRLSVPRNINIHDVVEAVKVYLNRKATPIVPDEIMTKLIENHNAGSTEEDIRIISQYRKMLPDVVPSVHYVLLLMNKVSKYSHINGMDERKLATIFVLDILKPLSVSEKHADFEKDRLERVQRLPYNIMVVEHLIRNVHIFEFAPYQQIHEPFISPPDEIVSSGKEKQLKWIVQSGENTDGLGGNFPDLPLLDKANAMTTPPRGDSKHSRKNLIVDKDGSPKCCSINKPRSLKIPKSSSLLTSEWSQEDAGKADDLERPSKLSSLQSNELSTGIFKKKREEAIATSSGVSSIRSQKLTGALRKQHSDIPTKPTINPKRDRKVSVEKSAITKDCFVNKDQKNHSSQPENIGDKTTLESNPRKMELLNPADRKRIETSKKSFLQKRSPSAGSTGKTEFFKPLSSPPSHKGRKEKSKKATTGPSSCTGYRLGSKSRGSPQIKVENIGESPARSQISRSATCKYAKRGRLIEAKNKMFKKDEELQPWDGVITESEDVSLIVRTTRNPKTFQFLEKYFMGIDTNGNIERIVFDPSVSSQQDSQPSHPKKSSRNTNKNTWSPRKRSPSPGVPTTTATRTVSEWSTRRGVEKVNIIDSAISSPDLQHSQVENNTSPVEDGLKQDNVAALGSDTQESPNHGCDGRVVSFTQIENQEGLKIKCKSSLNWNRGGPGSKAANKIKNLKENKHMWNKVVDWIVDTSLIGIAFFCAAYIYNVI